MQVFHPDSSFICRIGLFVYLPSDSWNSWEPVLRHSQRPTTVILDNVIPVNVRIQDELSAFVPASCCHFKVAGSKEETLFWALQSETVPTLVVYLFFTYYMSLATPNQLFWGIVQCSGCLPIVSRLKKALDITYLKHLLEASRHAWITAPNVVGLIENSWIF